MSTPTAGAAAGTATAGTPTGIATESPRQAPGSPCAV
jgi:hypothetical protein